MSEQQLIILGASARAACFSACRSGYTPYWIDQFGDHDLAARFAGRCVPTKDYPMTMPALIADAPPVPFLYTGAMENHLQVLEALEKIRCLLGNSAAVCRAVRDPQRVVACLQQAGIICPQACSLPLAAHSNNKNWLVKPLRSAGGLGINHYEADEFVQTEQHYLQECVDGDSKAGVFISDSESARLLGVTQQLVGEAFLHAGEFSYCGSVGPLTLDASEYEQWQRIGNALTADFGLKGLFGVDAISRAGKVYPLEVNPRYTASMEVLELASELPLIAMHCASCRGKLPLPAAPAATKVIAKACLFAGQNLLAPNDVELLYGNSGSFPLTADIPRPGTLIKPGHPVMTVLTEANSEKDAMQILMNRAKSLYDRFDIV